MASSDQHPLLQLLDAARWRLRSLDELRSATWFTKVNYINVFLFITFVVISIRQTRGKIKRAEKAAADSRYLPAEGFPEIETLPEFSWQEEEPLKLRTFKSKYHITMVDASALQKLDPSQLILMDKNYKDRISYRKKILKESHDIAVGVNDDERIRPAVHELYTWLMGTYLPKRYPTVFKLHKTMFETGQTFMLENLVTKEINPARASKTSDTIILLETLGRTLDEEFLFLFPEDTSEEKDVKYVLDAYVTMSPSGFNTRNKLGKRLADIHEPVPGYQKNIEGSMDRYFAKLQVGTYVQRANWNITTNPELFSPGSDTNHAREGDVLEQLESIDPEKTFLRCERQTLHRLPKSKAIVFAFKTYMYQIKDIKEEGLGEDLAEAVDGLREGNAPGMHFYKKGAVWGEAVKRYLRS